MISYFSVGVLSINEVRFNVVCQLTDSSLAYPAERAVKTGAQRPVTIIDLPPSACRT